MIWGFGISCEISRSIEIRTRTVEFFEEELGPLLWLNRRVQMVVDERACLSHI